MRFILFALATLLNSFAWAQARQPIFFDVQGRELIVGSPEIHFSLKNKGRNLSLGPTLFTDDSFTVKLEGGVLIVNWDRNLLPEGEISMINRKGDELWTEHVTGPGAWTYHEILDPETGPKWKSGDKFHFCLRAGKDRGFVSICTQTYAIEVNDDGVVLGPTKARGQNEAQIIIAGEKKKLEGKEVVTTELPVSFFASLKSGASLEFVSIPTAPVFRDMIQADNKDNVVLTGDLPAPLVFESKIYFRDGKELWQAEIPLQTKEISLPGKTGGFFTYTLQLSNPPPISLRKYTSKRSRPGTYAEKDKLIIHDQEGKDITWEFEAPNKFAMNHITFEITNDDHTYQISQDIYRGGSGEASVRLTGAATKGADFVYMGEGHISWWLNDVLDSQHDIFGVQRWGVSAKYFTSLNQIPVEGREETENLSINALDLDLRYRLTPGLWEKDGTLGLIAAYERVDFGGDLIPKIGLGVFWARSMPEPIDQILNHISFLNYPKWVDMEFIRYMASTDQDILLNDDYAVNFHGKINWTAETFGELGFGIKNYYFTHQSTNEGAALTTFYGTMGLGRNF